jgi:hypothetical protein
MADNSTPAPRGADRLVKQLNHLPTTIARMGLGIAEAQKELDTNFVHDVHALLAMFHAAMRPLNSEGNPEPLDEHGTAMLISVIEQFGATRYQFTETTLEFRADLAESFSAGASFGVSAGVPAVSVSASGSVAFGYDYNAAARISTVLHARTLKPEVTRVLLQRASELGQLPLPDAAQVKPSEELGETVKALAAALPKS